MGLAELTQRKILVVDDNQDVLRATHTLLTGKGYAVVTATNVSEALRQIVSQHFDVLVTDLHMPEPGDGFAVVTAMRHTQPDALTVVVSGFPDLQEAMAAILLQADEILTTPWNSKKLAELIQKHTDGVRQPAARMRDSVATILERDSALTISRWLERVEQEQELTAIRLTAEERTCYLPEMMRSIVARLRELRDLDPHAKPSPAAVAHGELRFQQGYSAPMLVRESRILQVCVFETIQRNLPVVDFSLVLPDVMLIADEVDAQLTQTMDSFLKMKVQ